MPPELAGQYALLGDAYDFPQGPPPTRRYLIISTPRSGSSLLAMRFWETGCLGAPLEYFNYNNWMLAMSGRLGASDMSEYVQRLLSVRTSPNGVFGAKAHTDHLQFLSLANLWPTLRISRIVWIERSDKLAQAVSLVIASQSGRFSSLDSAGRAPVYDAKAIAAALAYLERCGRVWSQFSAATKTPTLVVHYERLVEAGDAVIDEARTFLAPDAPPAPVAGLPRYERQAGAINAEWIARYKAESA